MTTHAKWTQKTSSLWLEGFVCALFLAREEIYIQH